LIITNKTKDVATLDYVEGQVLLINKELNWTSFDVANKVKYLLSRRLNIKKLKVGHGGTLDPLATGLMIVCIGKETKNQVNYQSDTKEYIAKITLGATTPSFDMETEINQRFPIDNITKEKIEEVLKTKFTGTIMQRPPLYSAKYVNGVRAYELAREGKEHEMAAQEVTISSITILSFALPEIEISVACTKGTYIRSLANDIGKELGCGAYLNGLVRTSSGKFSINDALTLAEFEKNFSTNTEIIE
jgi:tRNA pseudouridine55 synthase